MTSTTHCRMTLNEVHAIFATAEPEVYELSINLTDMSGQTYDGEYLSRPDDTFGLNPIIRKWLAENPNFPIQSHTPPAAEQIRASMLSLSARQLRLGLVDAGISPTQVTAAIDAMPDGQEKDRAQIEWEYATSFSRLHPLTTMVGRALGLTDMQIDAMWTVALDL
ncbi:hypothetical protein ABIE78_001277 [Sinorhizobium fredii]|jgi:hypothetical protein|uniref:Uncharacterized protein n=2 Tax=Rhizobium fredii TaxID=380 RepID=I3XAC7_SINF2|nr:hypothetical protein USDA257_c42940 [Sinorhizobium fredii USDA 257]